MKQFGFYTNAGIFHFSCIISGKKRATGKHRTIEQKADNPRKSETKSIAKEVIKTTGD